MDNTHIRKYNAYHGWYAQAKMSESLVKEADMDIRNIGYGMGAAALLGLGTFNSPSYGKEKSQQKIKQVSQSPKKNVDSNVSDSELEAFIAKWEGNKATAYKDTKGKLTVSIGFNLDRKEANDILKNLGFSDIDIKKIRNKTKQLTAEEISKIFKSSLETAKKDANNWIPNLGSYPKEVQKIVIDFAFNVGSNVLSQFPKARQSIINKNWKEAAKEMQNSAWYSQVGRRSKNHVQTLQNL